MYIRGLLITICVCWVNLQSSSAYGVELDRSFVDKNVDYLLLQNQFGKLNEEYENLKSDDKQFAEKVAEIKRDATVDFQVRLDALLAEKIEQLPLPIETETLRLSKEYIEKYNKEIELLFNSIGNLEKELKNSKKRVSIAQSNLAKKLLSEADERDWLNHLKQIREKLAGQLGIIADPDVISYIDTVADDMGPMSLLVSLTKNRLQQFLTTDVGVKQGTRGVFLKVPQGRSFLLWDSERQRLYDLDDLQLDEFNPPSFKPIDVSYKYENNVQESDVETISGETIVGGAWPALEKSSFGKCLEHKSFLDDQNPSKFCEKLFQDQAFLDLDLRYLRGGDGYIMSARAAVKFIETLETFFDEAKIILTDQYPKSFIYPFSNYLNEQIQKTSVKLTDIKSGATALEEELQKLSSTEEDLIRQLDELRKQDQVAKMNLAKQIAKNADLRGEYNTRFNEVNQFNEQKKSEKLISIQALQSQIEAIQDEIEIRFQDEKQQKLVALLKKESEVSNLKRQMLDLSKQIKRLKSELPDYFAQKYIDEHLRTKVQFKPQPYISGDMISCFGFELKGKYFLTQPSKIQLLFKGKVVTDSITQKYLRSDTGNYTLFTNKYNEMVSGIAPNKAGYKNSFRCKDYVSKRHYGQTSRYFEAAGGGSWAARNWSIRLIGSKLGVEDDLTSSSSRFKHQKATKHSQLFTEQIANLEVLAKKQVAEIENLTSRILDFRVEADIKILQSLLNRNGFGEVVPDGDWGPRSNAALVEFAKKNGLDYSSPDDWTMEIQTTLFTSVR